MLKHTAGRGTVLDITLVGSIPTDHTINPITAWISKLYLSTTTNMKLLPHRSRIKTIRQTDPNFTIQDGMIKYPRAALHILPDCPPAYKEIIEMCYQNGWLKTVAHVSEREMLFIGLSE